MATLKDRIAAGAVRLGTKIINSVSQKEAEKVVGEPVVTQGMPELLRRTAAECAVLLKNDGILPMKENSTVSVFGRVQNDWFYTGYGSGGDVKKPYGVNLTEGIRSCERLILNENLSSVYEKWCAENPVDHGVWGHWPRFYPEMKLNDDAVKNAFESSDEAVFIIGRSSGEDRENALEKGSYYLTDDERACFDLITKHFERVTVLLNIGSLIDLSWIEEYGDKIGAVMIVWQGGMESGNAVADLLCGKVSPSGRLTDTAAKKYMLYPSSANFGNKEYNEYAEDIYVGYRWFETFDRDGVLYPFGYGLSYTDFSVRFNSAEETEKDITFTCTVKNTGERAGRETVGLYVKKPCGALGNPARELVGFAKTAELAPGKSEKLTITVPREYLTSYDDCKKTEHPYSYVTLAGEYEFFMGGDVRSAERVYSFTNENTELFEKLSQTAAPKKAFSRYFNDSGAPKREAVKCAEYDLRKLISENLPEPVAMTGDRGYKLEDVKSGEITLREFVAQLDLDELEAISRGDYEMNSRLGTVGNAGALGGVTESMRSKGIPPVITTDGPSGIRLLKYTSLIPIGTALASSFDTALVKELYRAVGGEMKANGSDVLLAPGMNIHRSPLCGRNFEYYSEDPVLTGLMGAAAVEGVQSAGLSACPKHFACNNQEYNRTHNDSRVSERALREIYLKGFEICVKNASPKCIMTSYNKINGVWGHYQYELCERILRGEWGYDGMVMTDWWMRPSRSPEFPKMRDNAYRVRAGVDVLMPGATVRGRKKPDGTLLKTFGKPDGITSGEMQRTAMRVINLCMDIKI